MLKIQRGLYREQPFAKNNNSYIIDHQDRQQGLTKKELNQFREATDRALSKLNLPKTKIDPPGEDVGNGVGVALAILLL